MLHFLIWLLAVVLVVSGVAAMVRGAVLWGVVLVVVGILLFPGGYVLIP